MRTAIAPHELLPRGLDLESLSIETGHVTILVSSGLGRCLCPVCGRGSSRVHSRYSRAVSDLPWHGISVTLLVRARRLFCDEASCERRIFCERLPGGALLAADSAADLGRRNRGRPGAVPGVRRPLSLGGARSFAAHLGVGGGTE